MKMPQSSTPYCQQRKTPKLSQMKTINWSSHMNWWHQYWSDSRHLLQCIIGMAQWYNTHKHTNTPIKVCSTYDYELLQSLEGTSEELPKYETKYNGPFNQTIDKILFIFNSRQCLTLIIKWSNNQQLTYANKTTCIFHFGATFANILTHCCPM